MSIRSHPTRVKGHWYIQYRPNGRKGKLVTVHFEGTEGDVLVVEADLRKQNRITSISDYPRIAETIPDFMGSYRLDHQPAGVEGTLRSIKILMRHFGKQLYTCVSTALVNVKTATALVSWPYSFPCKAPHAAG